MSGDLSSDNRNAAQQESRRGGSSGIEGEFGDTARLLAREEGLASLGFTAEQISVIRQTAPDLNVQVLRPNEDVRISDSALQAWSLAFLEDKVTVLKLHGIVMVASKHEKVEEIINRYMSQVSPGPVQDLIDRQEFDHKASVKSAHERLPQFMKDWLVENRNYVYGDDTMTRIATDAHLVATTLGTAAAVKKWYEQLDTQQQNELVPGLFDGHSGSSFSGLAFLAYSYLKSVEASQ